MTWFAISLLLLVSFVFSGIEAGILSVNRIRLRNRAKHRDRSALRLEELLKKPEQLLLAVVIVTNLANIFALTLATLALVRQFGRAGYGIAFLVFLPVYFFGLELFPKALIRRFPTYALAFLSGPLRLVSLALSPILKWGSRLALRLFPPAEADSGKLFDARERFKYLTLESERTGAISPAVRQLIHGVVDFRKVTAREMMEPLADFPSISPEAGIEELIEASCGGTVEHFLAMEAGEILGLISLYETVLTHRPGTTLREQIRSLVPVPAGESALRVLRKLRTATASVPVALVMDGTTPLGLLFDQTLYRRLVSGG